jgi:hypothetical protein
MELVVTDVLPQKFTPEVTVSNSSPDTGILSLLVWFPSVLSAKY